MVACAMNEQGFLFAQKVQEVLQFSAPGRISPQLWQFVDREYPVTASNGEQTRIDLVFRNSTERGVYACIECKRADPLYKRWVFFNEDTSNSHGTLHFELVQVSQRRAKDVNNRPSFDANHVIRSKPSQLQCDVFNSYLEVAIDRRSGRAGYTETVETAFVQLMKGHTGMMAKLLGFDEGFLLCSIPILVTTAEIFRAKFHTGAVPLKTGKIESKDLAVEPLDFCAVNYHPNDELSLRSEHVKTVPAGVKEDLGSWQTRTIFVVAAEKIENFLYWLNSIAPEIR
jgi:hypothetical protein